MDLDKTVWLQRKAVRYYYVRYVRYSVLVVEKERPCRGALSHLSLLSKFCNISCDRQVSRAFFNASAHYNSCDILHCFCSWHWREEGRNMRWR